jgi:hypothetical protein
MDSQAETLGEKILDHYMELILGGAGGDLRVDIVAFALDPSWTR